MLFLKNRVVGLIVFQESHDFFELVIDAFTLKRFVLGRVDLDSDLEE